MTTPLTVLHLTAHLGGGVGKALSGLVVNTPATSGLRHRVVCLERPEKRQFIDRLEAAGCPVVISPDPQELAREIGGADLVQLEWWGHPALFQTLCRQSLPPMRLLVWYHVSGLYTPRIPAELLAAAHLNLFTSPATLEAPEVQQLSASGKSRVTVMHSAGGFEGLQPPERSVADPLVAGYMGSLNFAKLHPDFVQYLAAIDLPGFRLRLIGDETNLGRIQAQAGEAGLADCLDYRGYTTDIAGELAALNVLPYPLNPRHYGTSENALLEAMAMGVVPIVLDNPAERVLVEDGETGLVVSTPEAFGQALRTLSENPDQRVRMGQTAADRVRERFAVEKMVAAFGRHYRETATEKKREVPFADLFGRDAADWFLRCQRQPELFLKAHDGTEIDPLVLPGLLERTKGSVFHFQRYFPQDTRLDRWAQWLAQFA